MILVEEGGRKGRKPGVWRARVAMKKGKGQNKRPDPERYFLFLNSYFLIAVLMATKQT